MLAPSPLASVPVPLPYTRARARGLCCACARGREEWGVCWRPITWHPGSPPTCCPCSPRAPGFDPSPLALESRRCAAALPSSAVALVCSQQRCCPPSCSRYERRCCACDLIGRHLALRARTCAVPLPLRWSRAAPPPAKCGEGRPHRRPENARGPALSSPHLLRAARGEGGSWVAEAEQRCGNVGSQAGPAMTRRRKTKKRRTRKTKNPKTR